MNEIKRAIANFLFSPPPNPKEYAPHDLDNDRTPPSLASKGAESDSNPLRNSRDTQRNSKNTSAPVATQPTYKAAANASSSPVAESPALASTSPEDASELFLSAVSNGEVDNVRSYLAGRINLGQPNPEAEYSPLMLALISRNKDMVNLLLPYSSHDDKLSALTVLTKVNSKSHGKALKSCVTLILDSVNRENKRDWDWEKRQEEITNMTKLFSKFL